MHYISKYLHKGTYCFFIIHAVFLQGLEDETTRSKGSSFELIEKLKLGNRDKESVIDQLKSNHSTLEKQILSKDEK